MGSDKRQVRIGTETLLERAVRRGREGGLEILVVGGPAEIPAGARHVPDDHPGEGPMGGVLTVLGVAATPLAVVGVDMPDPSLPLLAELAASQPRIAAVPVGAGVPQPLHAVWGRGAAAAVAAAWADGQRSVRDFLANHDVQVLAEEHCRVVAGEQRWWRSLDTPTDVEEFSRPTGRPAPSP